MARAGELPEPSSTTNLEPVDRTVVFADLSGFTALTEAHGDLDAAAIARKFEALARSALVEDAHVAKTMGDAVMIVARDPMSGARVALGLAGVVRAEPLFPVVRIGMHHGPVVSADADYYGSTVNLAARVADHAAAGQVLCTAETADRVRDLGVDVREVGSARFRNVSRPIALCEIRWPERGPEPEIDPVCHMKITDLESAWRLVHEGSAHYFCSEECRRAFREARG